MARATQTTQPGAYIQAGYNLINNKNKQTKTAHGLLRVAVSIRQNLALTLGVDVHETRDGDVLSAVLREVYVFEDIVVAIEVTAEVAVAALIARLA